MRARTWIVAATLLGSGACGPDVVGESSAGGGESSGNADDDAADDTHSGEGPVDDTAADSAATGSGGVGESGGEQTTAADDPWQLCDAAASPEPPADAGACRGGVPAGELDGMAAEWIFGRATHELGHIGDVVQGPAEDGGLFVREGDDLWALTDSGYAVGRIARDDDTGRTCVRVAFACWTGGHGGFGATALDGEAEVLVDAEVVEARGELGLTEGGALTGAPSADVWVRIEGATVEGTVGEFAF